MIKKIVLGLIVVLFSCIILGIVYWNKIEFRIIKHLFYYPELCLIKPTRTVTINIPLNERTWIHAVNSKEKLKSVIHKASGIETDVMFDTINQYFDVSHYPEIPQSGLNYDSLLASIKNHSAHWYWIDFKNLKTLSKEEQNNALKELSRILNKYNIKNRAIIESENSQALTLFTDSGFYTSYWLPSINPYLRTKGKIKKWYSEVSKNISTSNITFISGPQNLQPLVRKYLPDFYFLSWDYNEKNLVFLLDYEGK